MDNRSDKAIRVYLALGRERVYPDTLIEMKAPVAGFRTVASGASTYFDSRVKWEEVFDQHLPSDTLSIFIFDIDTVNYYDWETVRGDYKVLGRYDLSLENLEYLDYKLPYPPTQWMIDNVKMYP